MRVTKAAVLGLAVLLFMSVSLFAQETNDEEPAEESEGESQETTTDFGLGLGIGVQSFTDPDSGDTETYQSLTLQPDVAIGKLGIGLYLTLNYRFTGGSAGNDFEVREEDWVPSNDTDFFELYLPKINYVRWARKGDPLFVQLGGLPAATLGNGFILGGYSNTLFRPERRIFGAQLDVDGRLFNFPYIGVETLAANLTAFDLFGGRFYVRPLVDTEIPVIEDLQLGTSYVADRDPYYFYRKNPDVPDSAIDDSAEVDIWGVDFRQPILSKDVFSLAAFGDYVRQDEAQGGMLGFGGRLASIIPYRAEARFLGDNFIPEYFDATYDIYRVRRYGIYSADGVVREGHIGWLARTGLSLLGDTIVFSVQMEGPFGAQAGVYPELQSSFLLNEGLVPGLTLQANYTKQEITAPDEVFDPENAIIGAQINYQTGPAVISLIYDLEYDPTATDSTPWNVTSRLESTISLY